MIIEHDEDDRVWVVTSKVVDGKRVKMRTTLAQYECEQEANRLAKEEQVAEKKATKKRQAAEKEQKQHAAKLAAITPLQATVMLARRGQKAILPKLRKILDEHPELVSQYGSLTLQVQETWLQLIAGEGPPTIRNHAAPPGAMRTELAGPNPSPLDKILVDRVLATHVEVLYFEGIETTDPTAENMRVARYRIDRREQAHRQFLSAVKMLATVRNLVARTNVIQVELLNPPMIHSPAAPIVPMANGEQLPVYNGHANRVKNRFNADVAGSINRLNGNRMSGILETIAPGAER